MSDSDRETVTDLAKLDAPFGKEILLQDVEHESGMKMLRLRIREGSRFTILDVDVETAEKWGAHLNGWVKDQSQSKNR